MTDIFRLLIPPISTQLHCLANPLIYLLAHDSVRTRAKAILTCHPCSTRSFKA